MIYALNQYILTSDFQSLFTHASAEAIFHAKAERDLLVLDRRFLRSDTFHQGHLYIDDDWLLISLNHALPGHAAWFQLRSMYVNVVILLECLLLTVGGGYPHILLQNSQRLFWKQDIHRSLLYMDWNYEFVWDCPFFNRKVILLNLNIDTVTQVTSLCTWCL